MSKSYKFVTHSGTVSSVDDAINELEALASECREIVDNASEGLSQTQRIQTFEETASSLENISSIEIPERVANLPIQYQEAVPRRKGGSTSRAVRCENALSILQAAVEASQNWVDVEDVGVESDDVDSAEQFISDLEQAISYAEGVEFPGMFG